MKVFSEKALIKDLREIKIDEGTIQDFVNNDWIKKCFGKTYEECQKHIYVYPEWFEEDSQSQLIKFLEDLKNESI